MYSRQLFSVGSHVQAKIRIPVTDSKELEHVAFSFGLQSVVNRHHVATQDDKPYYHESMTQKNKYDMDPDVFLMRFSLNASQVESPFLNHPAHASRKHLMRKIMDCAMPREAFHPQVKGTGSIVSDDIDVSNSTSSAGEQSKSEDQSSNSDANDANSDEWHKLEIIWLPGCIHFKLDGKVLRDFKHPQVMHSINRKLFCLQLVCSYPLSTLDWHVKMAEGGKFSVATSHQWLQAASSREPSSVDICDVRV